MFCNKCGKEINDESLFCNYCGNEIGNSNNHEIRNIKNNNKISKKILVISSVLLCLIIVLIFIIMNRKIPIPNVSGLSLDAAKTILENKGFITNIQYSFSEKVSEDKVISTAPVKNIKVKPNSIVTVKVSKGKSNEMQKIIAQDAVMEWFNIGNRNEDLWKFDAPIKEGNYITISCKPTFSKSFLWKGEKKEGFGVASINDTYDKTVPVKIIYTQQNVEANKEQNIDIKIPTQNLDTQKPTNLYLRLYALDNNNKDFTIEISFAISW